MRKKPPEKIEAGRVRNGPMASNARYGMTGMFRVHGPCGTELTIVSSEGDDEGSAGWEHVSVSTLRRPPNWQEMCWVKEAFFEDNESVVQFHPPLADYVNNHPHCLHLWRHISLEFPRPPSILVGIKAEGVLTPERAMALRKERNDP